MCSIQFAIMVAQTDVPVNAFGKILSRDGASYGDALCGKLGVLQKSIYQGGFHPNALPINEKL